MNAIKFPIDNMTDAEVLREFVKRFECDGAILIYMESNSEYGFGRWKNKKGKDWVKNTIQQIKSKQ